MKGLSSKCIALKVEVIHSQKIRLFAGMSTHPSARKFYRVGQ